MLPTHPSDIYGAAWEENAKLLVESSGSGLDQNFPYCATLDKLSTQASLDCSMGTDEILRPCENQVYPVKILHLCWLERGLCEQQRLVFTLFQPHTEKPWLHPNIYVEGLLYPNTQGGQLRAHTSSLDTGLWTPGSGRTTIHTRWKRSGNQVTLFKKSEDEA